MGALGGSRSDRYTASKTVTCAPRDLCPNLRILDQPPRHRLTHAVFRNASPSGERGSLPCLNILHLGDFVVHCSACIPSMTGMPPAIF